MALSSISQRLFSVEIPITEKIIRTVLVYGALLILLRLGGKRTAAQLNTFDLVVLLLVSNVVQNAIIGPDNSLVGGLIGAAALVGINDLVSRFARRNDAVDRAMEGRETRLVERGRFWRTTCAGSASVPRISRWQCAARGPSMSRWSGGPTSIPRARSSSSCSPRPTGPP